MADNAEGSTPSVEPSVVQDAGATAQPAVATPAPATPEAVSSTAADVSPYDDKAALLSVVKDAVAKTDGGASSARKEQASASKTDAGTEAPEAPPAEDGAKAGKEDLPPFHTHPRWKELVEQNKALSAKARYMDDITNWMDQHGLTPDQVSQGFEVMSLMTRDPMAAREALLDQVARIDEALGLKLPDDLRKKVDEGYVDEDTATELSKTRAAKARAEEQAKRAAEQAEAERARQAAFASRDAANAWEAHVRTTDPDYVSVKKPLMDELLKARVAAEGLPPTPEKALEMVKSTYERVNGMVKNLKPAPEPKKFVPSAPVSGTPRPDPQTPLDVVKRALGY